MDKYSISLIVIGSILIAIVARFIFNAAFRKDVIASEGEAKIFGLINVKGVIIVLLMAIFGGMFVYILDLSSKSNFPDAGYSPNSISSGSKYSHHTSAQIFKKQAAAWAIRHPDSTFSNLSNENENGFFTNNNGLASKQNERNTDSSENIQLKNRIWVGSPYQLKNCKLCFRIDSIINEQNNGTNYIFYVSFGEGVLEKRESIKWSNEKLSFNKSDNGKIDFEKEMIALSANSWKKDYLLYCGFGQPNAQLQSVEKVSLVAISTELELK